MESVRARPQSTSVQQVVVAQEKSKCFVFAPANFLEVSLLDELPLHGRQLGHHPLVGVVVAARDD